MGNKYLIVPQLHIDRLEDARLKLHKLLENDPLRLELPFGITDIMWEITHRKYKKSNEK